jgi:hypothetical protein
MTVEDGADRGCRDLYPEAQQFSLDALVAPARVLPRQTDGQLLDVLVERGSPGSASWVGPGARDEAAVPAQQGLRLDEEAGPASPRQHTADRSQQGPIAGSSRGGGVWRQSTASWWRRTRISRSLAASPRASWVKSWMERHNVR